MDAGVHIYTAMTLGRGRVASPTLSHLYSQGKPPVLIYRRLSGTQDQSGQEAVKKNLHPSDKFQAKPTHIISHDQILN